MIEIGSKQISNIKDFDEVEKIITEYRATKYQLDEIIPKINRLIA